MSRLKSELRTGWHAEGNLKKNLKNKRVLLKDVDPRKNVHVGMNSRHHARAVAEAVGGGSLAGGAYQLGRRKEYNKRGSNKGLQKGGK